VADLPKLKTFPVDADLVTEVAPKVFADVETAVVPNALEDGAPNPDAAGAAPKAGAGAAAPNGLAAAAGVAVLPPNEKDGLVGSDAAFPKANGVLCVVVAGGLAAPKLNAPPVRAALAVVAGAAPNEKDAAAPAAGAVAVDPNVGAAEAVVVDPKVAAAVVVTAGVEPKENNPEEGAAVVVAGAAAGVAPKLKGVTVATEEATDTAVVVPKAGATVEAAGAAPNVKSPVDAATEASGFDVTGVAVAPKLNGFSDLAGVAPKDGTVAAGAAWPRENVGAVAAVVVAAADAPKLKLGVGRVFVVSAVLVDPKEKTAGATVVAGTIEAAELTAGAPMLAAPKVKGTDETAALSAVSLLSAGLSAKLKATGVAEAVVVTAVGAIEGTVSVVTESASDEDGKLNLGTGSPGTGAGTVLSATCPLDRLNVTVAGLDGALDNRSGAVVVEGMPVTVLEVDMLPRERGVEVVVVDAGEIGAGTVTDAETSAVSAAGFDPKSNGNPPLVESYAGGGASNCSPRGKANPPGLETAIGISSSVLNSLGVSLDFSFGVRAF